MNQNTLPTTLKNAVSFHHVTHTQPLPPYCSDFQTWNVSMYCSIINRATTSKWNARDAYGSSEHSEGAVSVHCRLLPTLMDVRKRVRRCGSTSPDNTYHKKTNERAQVY